MTARFDASAACVNLTCSSDANRRASINWARTVWGFLQAALAPVHTAATNTPEIRRRDRDTRARRTPDGELMDHSHPDGHRNPPTRTAAVRNLQDSSGESPEKCLKIR
jgi:hypothetical protein